MATKIYDIEQIILVDGTTITIEPLKIKYLRKFMELFSNLADKKDNEENIDKILECVLVAIQQYYPKITTKEELEDSIDMPSIYKILDIAAGIRKKNKDTQKESEDKEGNAWDTLDLAKLEAEIFTLGIWKNFEELEKSINLPELFFLLESKRELDYQEKKFFAAIQGVDLDKQTGKANEQNAWEKMKAKVFSKGKTDNPNDIISFQGVKAQQHGFGIGMGLSYERID